MRVFRAAAVGAVAGGALIGGIGHAAARSFENITQHPGVYGVATSGQIEDYVDTGSSIIRIVFALGGATLGAVTAAAVTQNFNLALGETEPRDGNYPQ